MSAPPPARGLLRIALVVYLPMLACAAFLQPPSLLRVSDAVLLAGGLAAAALGGLGAVAGSRWVARRTGWGRRLHAEFHALLGGLDSPQILLLSLLSAGGEEVLFRGVLQPRLGLWVATLLFAGLHFPLRRTLVPWTGFAFALGLALGALTLWSASLWPAILLHFLVNYFNLHDLAAPLAPLPGASSAP
jgi:membrane protease YdiL (CAAX protease family)